MAELATVARPYAEALFKACSAGAGTDLQSAVAWVDILAAVAANSEMRQLADNPKVTAEQVFDVMADVAQQRGSELSEHGRNFLRTVIDNGRVDTLPEVATQFRALVNRQSGSSDAVVYSAFPMDDAALQELGVSLEKRFGRKLHLTVQQDQTLIGGIRVVVGDEVLDTSVKARLEQMKAALTA